MIAILDIQDYIIPLYQSAVIKQPNVRVNIDSERIVRHLIR